MLRARWYLLLVLLLACNRERTEQHEALAKTLASPAKLLCGESNEGGGCSGECRIWVAAEDGARAAVASERIIAIPTFADPLSEALLEDVRMAARKVYDPLAAACPKAVDRDDGMSPGIQRCADAAREHGASISALISSFQRLTDETSKRTGVAMPKAWQPCPPPPRNRRR